MVKEYLTIVELQDKLKKKINPEWRKANYNWDRYIWTECAEFIESTDYKHWKHQKIDYNNLKIELVDIFHFILSKLMTIWHNNKSVAKILNELNRQLYQKLTTMEEIIEAIEEIVYYSVNKTLRDDWRVEQQIIYLTQIWDSLFPEENILHYYLAKNTLNIFRQNNGYKQGAYKKIWNGKEDNEVALEIVKKVGFDIDKILKELEKEYKNVQ